MSPSLSSQAVGEDQAHGEDATAVQSFPVALVTSTPNRMASIKRGVLSRCEKDLRDEVAAILARARVLTNWVPKLKRGKKLIVEGNLLEMEGDRTRHFEERWVTSRVQKCLLPCLIATRKSFYVLHGALDDRHHTHVPKSIAKDFANGFPGNWQGLLEQWHQLSEKMH